MNPRLTDVPLEQRDCERCSGLPLDYFYSSPRDYWGTVLVVAAVVVAIVGAGMYYAGMLA